MLNIVEIKVSDWNGRIIVTVKMLLKKLHITNFNMIITCTATTDITLVKANKANYEKKSLTITHWHYLVIVKENTQRNYKNKCQDRAVLSYYQ